jgi:hypothetical protein
MRPKSNFFEFVSHAISGPVLQTERLIMRSRRTSFTSRLFVDESGVGRSKCLAMEPARFIAESQSVYVKESVRSLDGGCGISGNRNSIQIALNCPPLESVSIESRTWRAYGIDPPSAREPSNFIFGAEPLWRQLGDNLAA